MHTTLVQLTDERLPLSGPSGPRRFWTTLEGQNPGGSIKDRMVRPELERALKAGEIKSGSVVSEISAGSTAISLAYHCTQLGLQCRLFIPNNCPEETVLRLKNFGADIEACDPKTAYADYEKFLTTGQTWPFQQMARKQLRDHYTQWAQRELLPKINFDVIAGAVGTGHSLLGVSAAFPRTISIAAEPLAQEPLAGVRNLNVVNFGENDPCEVQKIHHRTEVPRDSHFFNCFFNNVVKSDLGTIEISDTFRLTLSAACIHLEHFPQSRDIFLIGSHNRPHPLSA